MLSLIRLVLARPGRVNSVAVRGFAGILLILATWMPMHRANAAALNGCNAPTVTLTAVPTANILVPNQVGSVVYRGAVNVTRTCNTPSVIGAINSSNNIVLGGNIGTTTTVLGSASWLGIRITSQDSSIAGTNCVRVVKTQTLGTSHTYQIINFVGSSVNATCTINYSYTVEIYVKQLAGAAVVAFPYADPTGLNTLNSTKGWIVWEDNGTHTGHNLAAINVNFVPVGCTVSTSNIVVNLPAASITDLDAPGKTAQPQAFNIGLTGCYGLASTYSAVATWSFTQLGANAGVITNSAASGAASNVGIQLLDGNSNPITSNGTSTLVSIPTSGTYSSTLYARYYAVGAATAGNVQGIATFNVTYN